MPVPKDYHKILDLERDASTEEIKQAYRSMAKKYHPDINKSPDAHDRFIEITEAYEILMNRDLHEYYISRSRNMDSELMREYYERAREAAKESARRYAKMKFEKFSQEQEAFKKSGWHDMILTMRYIIRILVFPLISFFIVMPLLSEQVQEHWSGYVIYWLIAIGLIIFVFNHWKGYLRIDSFYYHFSDLTDIFRGMSEKTDKNCYYCSGHKAMKYPYRIQLFRIRKIHMQDFGDFNRSKAGSSRDFKVIRIPRSRKAFLIHTISSILKIASILLCSLFLTSLPLSRLSLPIGLISGSLVSGLFHYLSSTRPKVSFFLSRGLLIKFFVWVVLIWFFGGYAFIFLFFDPMLEALLRFISKDRLFIPLLKQYPELDKLFRKQYQYYMELPVLSVISPFFLWLL